MPLNFDFSRCARQDLVVEFGDENDVGEWIPSPDGKFKKPLPTTEAAIWLLLAIDMTGIDEHNLPEVYTRMRMYEHCFGAFRQDSNGPVFMTYASLVPLIGLRTNVPTIKPHAFATKVARRLREEAQRSLHAEMDAAEKALKEAMDPASVSA